jgi:uncharacterized protein
MRNFTWDPIKSVSNLSKHGVAFEDALLVFNDSMHLSAIDNHVGGQERWKTIGFADGILLLTVIHTSIDEDGNEYIRIISARQATPVEEKLYSEGLGQGFLG